MNNWYRPERMVIAGAGMVHEELVELADKHFSGINYTPPPAPQSSAPRTNGHQPQFFAQQPTSPSIYKSLTRAASSYLYPAAPNIHDPTPLFNSTATQPATYTGGHKFLKNTTSEFNHLYLAFEGVGIHDDDVYTLATMQVLLGGGGSFSAGQSKFTCLASLSVCLHIMIPHVRWSWKGHVLPVIH